MSANALHVAGAALVKHVASAALVKHVASAALVKHVAGAALAQWHVVPGDGLVEPSLPHDAYKSGFSFSLFICLFLSFNTVHHQSCIPATSFNKEIQDMKAISLLLVATIALVATAAPTAEPLNCPCDPGKRDPWHPACCPDPTTAAPKVVEVTANAGTAEPLDCPCGPGKRDPWHPSCCLNSTTVSPKMVQ
ncbi:hypothetical protein BGX30_008071 [Mortierella sp. GBA39]|nr:hypothetical protein BGX30_008071 [Mortierella sp. GBA39]